VTTVTHRHFREVGFCNRGLRAEALRHGIDWAGFLKSGIDAQALRALGNAMAERAIARAEKEVQNGQQ